MHKLGASFLLSVLAAGAVACSAASTPSEDDLAAALAAKEGAFVAFDEACLGVGDLSASLPRAKEKGWIEFTPVADSLLDKHREMLLDGPVFDRPEVAFLRKNSNRAEIVMWETRTLSGADYIFNCEVVEASAPNLDLAVLNDWANVPIEERQIDDSPVYYDLIGGRFANGGGGKATAYFTSGDGPRETLAGLNIHSFRSSFSEEGAD